MTRDQVNTEIKETLGIVPTMFNAIPDSDLESEWTLFKNRALTEGPVGLKERELIGLGISAVTKCKYCVYFHTEVAKLHGATDEEIQATLNFAKHTSGWSTFVNGLQLDYDQFTKEVDTIGDYVRSMHDVHH